MSYEYETIADIIRLSEENNISFGDVVMRSELEQYDRLMLLRSTKLMRKCSELWLAQRRGLVALCLAPFRPWLSNTN